MTAVLLKRLDPEEHINRWYMVRVQPTLLDPVAVICAWGSRETSWQQMQIFPMPSWEEAEHAAAEFIAQKLKRGYVVVEEEEK